MHQRRPTSLLLCLLALLFAVSAQAQSDDDGQRIVIEIISLTHRPPDGIRQALLPQLLPGARIGQIGEHLIIASSNANIAQLRALIERLDTPPRELRVTVDFAYPPDARFADNDAGETASEDTNTPSTPVSTAQHSVHVVAEEQTLVLRRALSNATSQESDAGDADVEAVTPLPTEPRFHLALRLTLLPAEQIQLNYGYSDSDNVVADMHKLLSPGQWHLLGGDDEAGMAINPLEFMLGDEADGRLLAIRVDPLP